MNFDEQTDAFRFDLDNLCSRYLGEFDINVFTEIGCLREKKLELINLQSIIEDKMNDLTGEDIDFEVDEDFFSED
jgi:hypothetical protein